MDFVFRVQHTLKALIDYYRVSCLTSMVSGVRAVEARALVCCSQPESLRAEFGLPESCAASAINRFTSSRTARRRKPASVRAPSGYARLLCLDCHAASWGERHSCISFHPTFGYIRLCGWIVRPHCDCSCVSFVIGTHSVPRCRATSIVALTDSLCLFALHESDSQFDCVL